jgi:hypothetical protein
MAMRANAEFVRPSALERSLNRAFGALVGLGFGFRHNYLLQVPGRQTRRIHSTPVNVLEIDHRLFLVCPRGRAQWVRNAEPNGWILLKKRRTRKFTIRPVAEEQKPLILKTYLERFRTTVQQFFPVSTDSPPIAFSPYAAQYPVFELRPVDEQ